MASKMLSLLNSDKNIDEIIPILKNTYKLYVRVDDESDLILVKYLRDKSNFEEPIVNECRGIVMTRDKKVICFY